MLAGEDILNKDNYRMVANLLSVGFRLNDVLHEEINTGFATLLDHPKQADHGTLTSNSVTVYNTIIGQVEVLSAGNPLA